MSQGTNASTLGPPAQRILTRKVVRGDEPVHWLIGVIMNPKVDAYIRRSARWPEEMTDLRPILLSGGLTEEIKWGKPCYSHEGKNIVILQEMKEFLALMFF